MRHLPVPGPHRADRCDRCGVQAHVGVRLPSGRSLLWCGHHFTVYRRSLTAAGATVFMDHRTAVPADR